MVCTWLPKRQLINWHSWEWGVLTAGCEEWFLAMIVIKVVADSLPQTQSATDHTEPELLPKKFQPEKLPGLQKVCDFDWFLDAIKPTLKKFLFRISHWLKFNTGSEMMICPWCSFPLLGRVHILAWSSLVCTMYWKATLLIAGYRKPPAIAIKARASTQDATSYSTSTAQSSCGWQNCEP